jgi:hypothetical protein
MAAAKAEAHEEKRQEISREYGKPVKIPEPGPFEIDFGGLFH